MKSSEEILERLSQTIAHMHRRPGMHADSLSASSAASVLDGIVWQAHTLWAWIQDRDREFRRTFDAIREQRSCGPFSFADYYRREHPEATNEDVSKFVLSIAPDNTASIGVARALGFNKHSEYVHQERGREALYVLDSDEA